MNSIRVRGARFFIVRHAEALKNIEKMHGGGTQDLTTLGVSQLLKSIDDLRPEILERKVNILYQKEGRSKKTAEIIGQKFEKSSYVDRRRIYSR